MKFGTCPSQNSNTDAYSNNFRACRYTELASLSPNESAIPPNSSIRVRKPTKMTVGTRSPQYLRYSVPHATKAMDKSWEWPEDSGEFPKNIYNKEPFAGSIDYWHSPRDPTWLYTYSPDPEDCKDRINHPPTQSRFGYDRFLNEYGLGEQSRGYVEPPECHLCSDTPTGVAPLRFYDPYYLNTSPSEFRKMNDAMIPMTMMIK